jgi:hypothetical protein
MAINSAWEAGSCWWLPRDKKRGKKEKEKVDLEAWWW